MSQPKEKKFAFVSEAAKRAYLDLPDTIKQQFGTDLNAIQQGKRPFSEIKDVSASVGQGTYELIENGSPAYRALYCAKFADTVYILHAFTKTTNNVDQKQMDTAAARYKEMTAQLRAAAAAAKKQARRG
ncbi:type II toxin-antitoxin system RelE/ParE family toxin [Stenotrophomonas sp. JC08]|uniref:type II toxin-antitoxin system RelE/ParE family toxin n=1 Tax=Stenotrophomonas sp. JC08 TaxID=3445779 RepID=UPI003FA2210A